MPLTLICFGQLLAVFMQLGARELLMHYMDLKQTNDVQLTFEALKVTHSPPTHILKLNAQQSTLWLLKIYCIEMKVHVISFSLSKFLTRQLIAIFPSDTVSGLSPAA